tara:strand:- start:266 stop:484 length:219 start_codon:yes stop_codon:yes gene_type:complete
MSNEIAFETNAFAVNREVWIKASNFLGIEKENTTFQIRRLSPNKVQITKLSGDIMAESSARVKGNKKPWSQG